MMGRLSSLVKAVFILLVAVLVSAVVFVSVFDANEYKPEIIEQVERATGRSVRIDGDIRFTLFPWVGLKLERAALGNARGFSEADFASLQQLNVQIKVLPLLRAEVRLGKVQLHGLRLSLEVDRRGRNNWTDLSAPSAGKPAGKPVTGPAAVTKPAAGAAPSGGGLPVAALQVEGVELIDAALSYTDAVSGTRANLSGFSLQTGEIGFDRDFDVRMSAHVRNNRPALDTQIDLQTVLRLDASLTRFDVTDLRLAVAAKASDTVPQDMTVTLGSTIHVDMQAQTVTVERLSLDALQTRTLLTAEVGRFLQQPVVRGQLTVAPFNARKLAETLQVTLPEMASDRALTSVGLASGFDLEGQRLKLDHLSVRLDDSVMTGWVHVEDMAAQRLRYQLAVDQIDVNDYLPPVAAEPAADRAAGDASAPRPAQGGAPGVSRAGSGQAAGHGRNTAAESPDAETEKIVLPVELMKTLDLEGRFEVAKLHVQEYDITALSMETTAARGVIDVDPLRLSVLDGKIDAGLQVDVRAPQPRYRIRFDGKQIQAGPVVNPYLENTMGDKPMFMQGAVDIAAGIATRGDTVRQLKQAAKGKVTLDMSKTSVRGFDPGYRVRSSMGDYLDDKGLGNLLKVRGDYNPREVTVFDIIHDTAHIANGKVTTDDFLMDSKRVTIRANGGADLMSNTLDVTASVKLARRKTVVEKILDEPLFVHVFGPFSQPQYEVDTKRLSKNVDGMLKAEAKARVDAARRKAKQKAQQALAEKKRKLKAKQAAEKQRLREKADAEKRRLQEKLKNKLKGLF